MSGAFRNDPALKAGAMADVAAATHPGWTNVASDEDRIACADRFGLSPNLVALLSVASNAPYWDGSSAFMTECVAAIEPGTDTLALARMWAVARWTDGPFAVGARLTGTPAHDPALDVFAAAGGGTPLPRSAWRLLRARLSALEGLSATTEAYAAVAAALAWDEDATIGVHADVWKAWQEAIRIENDAAAGWDQSVQDAVMAALREATVTAHAVVSPRFGGTIATEEASAAQAVEVAAIMAASPLHATFVALQDHWRDSVTAKVGEARQVGLASLLTACRADHRPAGVIR